MSARGTAATVLVASGTAGAGVRHLPHIGKESGAWRMTCTCGTQGAAQGSRRLAAADFDAHLIEVCDVPPGERCRMNREHRLKPWERCELCANQLPLFDLAEVDR